MPSATIEGTESRPDSGRYAPLCAVHYTLRPKIPVPARLRVRFHSPRSGWPRKVTSIMEGSVDTMAHLSGSSMSAQGGVGLALIAFLFEHAGCVLVESRLGEDLLACWCPQCNEAQTFGTLASRTYTAPG
jgi:hypothetical protein